LVACRRRVGPSRSEIPPFGGGGGAGRGGGSCWALLGYIVGDSIVGLTSSGY